MAYCLLMFELTRNALKCIYLLITSDSLVTVHHLNDFQHSQSHVDINRGGIRILEPK